jgi:hypothetical protein
MKGNKGFLMPSYLPHSVLHPNRISPIKTTTTTNTENLKSHRNTTFPSHPAQFSRPLNIRHCMETVLTICCSNFVYNQFVLLATCFMTSIFDVIIIAFAQFRQRINFITSILIRCLNRKLLLVALLYSKHWGTS